MKKNIVLLILVQISSLLSCSRNTKSNLPTIKDSIVVFFRPIYADEEPSPNAHDLALMANSTAVSDTVFIDNLVYDTLCDAIHKKKYVESSIHGVSEVLK